MFTACVLPENRSTVNSSSHANHANGTRILSGLNTAMAGSPSLFFAFVRADSPLIPTRLVKGPEIIAAGHHRRSAGGAVAAVSRVHPSSRRTLDEYVSILHTSHDATSAI